MLDPPRETTDQRMAAVLELAGAYFMGKSPIHAAADEIARHLEDAGIDYAIAGALSLGFHGFVRVTEDVHIIISREGLGKFKETWLGRGYVNLRAGGKPVRDTIHNVRIDFLLTGEFPGDGKPKPVAIPAAGSVAISAGKYRVVSLPALVELKLASGMTAPHRLKDLADVVALIRAAHIPKELGEQLHPYVREKFTEMWELAQHPDDEY